MADREKKFLLHPHAAEAWRKMKATAKSQGIELWLVSAFRSIERQNRIIEKKKKKGIPDRDIFRVSAPAGFSEHHSGRAIDISTEGYTALEKEFENSEAFQWLNNNASVFGFILSYPRGNEYGIAYEPWHWLYKR
ncbi:M15 family metallopeptidase [Rubellicoccus peritrichatus]|uniref:M15 family metallopeptidase n=1 Tax=Rubellicoccus peritrichatus TaxID=3080537 RepID=A0AAQ3QVP7_9BACT|nr:M15 family metallopeptidase [Puniceicoccus sp. CR14]WOO41130.1 M15 family metallopeptidase [Puniceicoccus sp. CR14]